MQSLRKKEIFNLIWYLVYRENGQLRPPLTNGHRSQQQGQPLVTLPESLPETKHFSLQVAQHVGAISRGVCASSVLRPIASRRPCLTDNLWSASAQPKFAFSTSKCYYVLVAPRQRERMSQLWTLAMHETCLQRFKKCSMRMCRDGQIHKKLCRNSE